MASSSEITLAFVAEGPAVIYTLRAILRILSDGTPDLPELLRCDNRLAVVLQLALVSLLTSSNFARVIKQLSLVKQADPFADLT